jgi:hypothetical protein
LNAYARRRMPPRLMALRILRKKNRARADEMEAQRGARPTLDKNSLQKARGAKTCDRIGYRR